MAHESVPARADLDVPQPARARGFRDRREAGRALGEELRRLQLTDVVVLGLPRGGIPVAEEVAAVLDAPLDRIVVRKLGVPAQPELAMGAVGEMGVRVLNPSIIRGHQVSTVELEVVSALATHEVVDSARAWRDHHERQRVLGRVAVVVDDGVATGATARAGCRVARAQGAREVILAVPIGSRRAVAALQGAADRVVCLQRTGAFWAVGHGLGSSAAAADGDAKVAGCRRDEVVIRLDGVAIAGQLAMPEDARGIVIVAQASGTSRCSTRNRRDAGWLHEAGLGSLVLDLLTPLEERSRSDVFDVEMLGARLVAATTWFGQRAISRGLPLALLGTGTGAAAALWAAAELGNAVAAVVSRAGRPDLVGNKLGRVVAPTMLAVAEQDAVLLALNRRAEALMSSPVLLALVTEGSRMPGEPPPLDAVFRGAPHWLTANMAASAPASARRVS